VSRPPERVFVDTGAWIALAVVRDSLHDRARGSWSGLQRTGARLYTSAAVVLETFTFLDRKGSRDLANRWMASVRDLPRMHVLDLTAKDIDRAAPFLERPEFHKLSLVDATSFVLMADKQIRTAFSFDTHFAVAGFRLV